jgi:hypothetical protein
LQSSAHSKWNSEEKLGFDSGVHVGRLMKKKQGRKYRSTEHLRNSDFGFLNVIKVNAQQRDCLKKLRKLKVLYKKYVNGEE